MLFSITVPPNLSEFMRKQIACLSLYQNQNVHPMIELNDCFYGTDESGK